MLTHTTENTGQSDQSDDLPIDPLLSSPGEPAKEAKEVKEAKEAKEAKEVKEETRGKEVIKGKGRPKADGTMGKADKEMPATVPTPPFKKYWSNATNRLQSPNQLIKWYEELPQWARDRIVCYVERDWPVLVKITKEEKALAKAQGKDVEHNYIDKLLGPPETMNKLLDMYGAGDYHLVLNDIDAFGPTRTLTQCWVKENWRDIRTNPPTDRRIDNVENVDLTDPSNRSYVEFLKAKGKLPEQNQGANNMAEATAVASGIAGQSMAMADKLINRLMDSKDRDKGNNDTTATVVKEVMEVMGAVTEKASDVMKSAYEQTAANRPQQMSMKEMVEVMKELKGDPAPVQASDSTVLLELMKEMRLEREANNKLIADMQNKRIESLEKMLENKVNPQAQGTGEGGMPTSQVSGLVSGVDQIVSVVEKLGFRKNGVTSVVAESGGGAWWRDMIPDVVQGLQSVVGNFAQVYTTKLQMDDREAQRRMAMQTGQPIPMGPVPVMPQMPQPIPPAILQPEQQPNPNPQPEQVPEEDRDFIQFMSEIKRPIMNHVNRNLGGAAFAQWMIDTYDEATFEQVRQQGKGVFIEALMRYEPIAKELMGKEGLLVVFADEFCRMEEVMAEEAEEGEEGEEEEEEVTV